ncbi:MAG: alpha/beta hydrolase [Erysipelotrichaceae bacterium]|nr:alpha/beta hydrolase [Erysipelotrichaceae bacterium]
MSRNRKGKKVRTVPIGLGILVFIIAFSVGVISKIVIQPSWAKRYSVEWNDEIGTLLSDLSYGDKEANKFDLYLPKDDSKENYGLVVYLHAGGFTSGDKAGDREMLVWLCSKGYVTAGINYTLRTDENSASVLSQSNEIKTAIPVVIEEAEKAGYHIDKMTMAGGSAGHCLAMIYTYRDGADAPVPVVFTFGAVGPSCFYQEDWGIYGLDQNDEACAGMFSVMAGTEITEQDIRDGSYLEKVKPISATEWISNNPVPSVVAYGKYDKVQPYLGSLRLKATLEENNVDFRYFELPHSGHGLQNDNAIQRQWMEAVEEYLDKYMPVQ